MGVLIPIIFLMGRAVMKTKSSCLGLLSYPAGVKGPLVFWLFKGRNTVMLVWSKFGIVETHQVGDAWKMNCRDEQRYFILFYCHFYIQSNFGSPAPWIMNNSVYEQIFRTQNVSDDVLCLELQTRKPSTSWSDKLGVSVLAVFVEEWSSGKYPESATPIGESVSCCVAFVYSNSLCLLLNFSVIKQ